MCWYLPGQFLVNKRSSLLGVVAAAARALGVGRGDLNLLGGILEVFDGLLEVFGGVREVRDLLTDLLHDLVDGGEQCAYNRSIWAVPFYRAWRIEHTESGTATGGGSVLALLHVHVHIGLGSLHHLVVHHVGLHHVVEGGHGGAEEESGDAANFMIAVLWEVVGWFVELSCVMLKESYNRWMDWMALYVCLLHVHASTET